MFALRSWGTWRVMNTEVHVSRRGSEVRRVRVYWVTASCSAAPSPSPVASQAHTGLRSRCDDGSRLAGVIWC